MAYALVRTQSSKLGRLASGILIALAIAGPGLVPVAHAQSQSPLLMPGLPMVDPIPGREGAVPVAPLFLKAGPKQASREGGPAPGGTQFAEVYYQRGLALLGTAHAPQPSRATLDLAIAAFSTALRLDPTLAAAHVGRGTAYAKKGDFRPAIIDFSEAIRRAPGDSDAFLQRGLAHQAANDTDQAIADYAEAHRLQPGDIRPLLNRGIVYYTRKADYGRAIADFSAVLAIDPGNPEALAQRGLALAPGRAFDKALADLDRAIDESPSFARAYYYRGVVRVLARDIDHGLDDFDTAIRLDPGVAKVYFDRARLQAWRGEHGKAIADLDRVVALAPGAAAAYYNRAASYFAIGAYAHARADYNEAQALGAPEARAGSCLARGMLGDDGANPTMASPTTASLASATATMGAATGSNPAPDCTQVLAGASGGIEAREAQALAALRQRNFAQAIAGFDRVLKDRPREAHALYGRGLARIGSGDTDRGRVDMAMAVKMNAGIVTAFTATGLEPPLQR